MIFYFLLLTHVLIILLEIDKFNNLKKLSCQFVFFLIFCICYILVGEQKKFQLKLHISLDMQVDGCMYFMNFV